MIFTYIVIIPNNYKKYLVAKMSFISMSNKIFESFKQFFLELGRIIATFYSWKIEK